MEHNIMGDVKIHKAFPTSIYEFDAEITEQQRQVMLDYIQDKFEKDEIVYEEATATDNCSDVSIQLLESIGVHAFNYKMEKPLDALLRLAPNGLDIYFDNVGGEILESALEVMNDFGRIIACGSISGYDQPVEKRYGVRNLFHIVAKRLTFQGYITDPLSFTMEQFADANQQLSKWLMEKKIIDQYTRESGVRGLEKVLSKMIRYVAKSIAMNENYVSNIDNKTVESVLGPPKYDRDRFLENTIPGVVTGLAWTSVGGDILFIESSLSKGKGQLTITGNIGKIMKESATLSLEFLKSNSELYGIDNSLFQETNVHIHVPEGATPKDGPSAGITMFTSLVSLFTKRLVKKKIAMTGEITLRGKVLPVGGIKEKLLAAKRSGIKEIVLSSQNKKDVSIINKQYLKDMTFHYVDSMHDVIEIALEKK